MHSPKLGYNPLRWNCAERGCFNTLKRPKIEVFSEALPRRMAFSDVDAITEYRGHFLMMEWKSYRGDIPTGQRIMFERLTVPKRDTTVFVVAGNAETMEVTDCLVYAGGKSSGWQDCSLDGLISRIREWVSNVDSIKQG